MTADALGDETRDAIEDYRRIFPVPCALAPNLALASGLLAERDALAAKLDAVLPILAEVKAAHEDRIGTHWATCYLTHSACLAVLLHDTVEPERTPA